MSPQMRSLLLLLVCHSSVFIADTGREVFVWIGSGASDAEKKNAMTYAHVSTHTSPHNPPTNGRPSSCCYYIANMPFNIMLDCGPADTVAFL